MIGGSLGANTRVDVAWSTLRWRLCLATSLLFCENLPHLGTYNTRDTLLFVLNLSVSSLDLRAQTICVMSGFEVAGIVLGAVSLVPMAQRLFRKKRPRENDGNSGSYDYDPCLDIDFKKTQDLIRMNPRAKVCLVGAGRERKFYYDGRNQ